MRLVVGIVTGRDTYWPWLVKQLAAQHLPHVDLFVMTVVGPGHPPAPRWFGDVPARYVEYEVPARTSLPDRYNRVLQFAAALGDAWVCFIEDDDVIAPSHLQTLARRVQERQTRSWAVGLPRVAICDARQPQESLADCATRIVDLEEPFVAFTQSAYRVGRGFLDPAEHSFPAVYRAQDSAWLLYCARHLGQAERVEGDVTYLAVAHGSNTTNDAAGVDPNDSTVRQLVRAGALPAFAEADLGPHPSWRP